MDTPTLTVVVALIVAIGSVITAVSARRKGSAEASQIITESAMKLLDPLNARIDQMQEELDELKKDLTKYKRGVAILIAQLKRMKVNPDWTPENDKFNRKDTV